MSPFPVIHFSKEDEKIRKRYLEEISPNPEVYCLLTFGVHNKGDPNCKHEWKKIKDEDDYAVWKCSKCLAEAGCDVGD